jgi:hypothetical protein
MNSHFIKEIIGTNWKNQITVPKDYTPHMKDKELIKKRKNSEFMDLYNKIVTKNNRSASFTNLNYSVKIIKIIDIKII